MSEYTSRNNSNVSNYSTATHNHSRNDKVMFDDNPDRKTWNDLTKSVWFPSAVSSVENKYDRSIFPDGPMTTSFENYVHNIFRPGNKLPKLSYNSGNSISAHSMLRVQDLLGSAALNESFDEDIMKVPLEKMFTEYGLTGCEDYLSYSSYYPKNNASSIYGSTVVSPFQSKDSYTSYRKKANECWKRNNKQMIIDYKGSDMAPLTPYMYAEHPYVRSQDSRIVGSNFVQITSRPKDSFLEKIDRTLAEVRAMPRF
ncbi:hypothetical protein X798_01531 [Onchocerca flexuosa]|uniref:Serine/threonine-protein kinase n=2 Tax=Onchocerca flexuosa TaxID=387005 RepID=A0A183GZS7_9BILA|nr:hypothetical protein X798_01531 [Onchocerca flexuosa]VDO26881.1 unnamed protein product [Onchocerca flexuosa]